MKQETYTITVESENKPGVLYRIAGIFVRRKINVEKLTVYETKTKGRSRFTIIVNTTEDVVVRVIQSIRKVVEVHSAEAQKK